MEQSSREALIDLLTVALYLDKRISVVEDEAMSTALETLGWESSKARAEYLFKGIAIARSIDGNAVAMESLLDEKSEIVKGNNDEAEALSWLSQVLGSGGMTFSEQQFLSQLESRLFLNL
jgi:hypothetical protein